MNMTTLTRESLMTLEAYAKARPDFRARVLAHKKHRAVALGDHLTVLFEDELTVRYQIQEMLRIEKTFEEDGIAHELATYTPLVPDGTNLKATMLVEYEDEALRRRELARLIGIEDHVWVQVAHYPRAYAIADEDMERENEDKTSAVHFLRFELGAEAARALKAGAALGIGVDHPNYRATIEALTSPVRDALAADIA